VDFCFPINQITFSLLNSSTELEIRLQILEEQLRVTRTATDEINQECKECETKLKALEQERQTTKNLLDKELHFTSLTNVKPLIGLHLLLSLLNKRERDTWIYVASKRLILNYLYSFHSYK
jgi:septal ring factor EnvC (AmiA/AmiB activator)